MPTKIMLTLIVTAAMIKILFLIRMPFTKCSSLFIKLFKVYSFETDAILCARCRFLAGVRFLLDFPMSKFVS